ncbi:MAG: HAD family hydrolase [Syntrophaceae bacterium]|nr:HAD family hydrolase [Syntrophaceae bacterium]
MKKNRVVFLDRDGTICEEVGYLSSVEQMRLIPRSGEAVRLLNQRGYKVVVITNQAGVARGFFPESALEGLHAEMLRQLGEEGAHLDGIYYCPHHPIDGIPPYRRECNCRKPATGLLERAAADLNLDLPSGYMIGDHFSDVECGQRVGAETVLLLTGHGQEALAKKENWPQPPSYIAADLYEAVLWVLGKSERA